MRHDCIGSQPRAFKYRGKDSDSILTGLLSYVVFPVHFLLFLPSANAIYVTHDEGLERVTSADSLALGKPAL